MKLALISDIHSNFQALSSLSDLLEQADKVICLGDIIGYYCQVNEVIEYIRDLNALCVLGNHDSFLLNGCPDRALPAVRFGIEFADRIISAENRKWLADLPLIWGGSLGNRSLLLVHGSPWRPLDEYLYSNNPALKMLDDFHYDIIAFGQTHRSMKRTDCSPYLLNPGSVGQSRDNVMKACAMIVDTKTMEIESVERSYDAAMVIEMLNQNGAGDWARKYLC